MLLSVKFIANKSEEEKETPSWVLSAAFRRIPCGKIRYCVSWFVHTCFCSAFRKVLSMNFEKRLYSQLKQKVSTVIRGGYSMSSMTSKTEKSQCIPSHDFKCSALFYLAPPWNLTLVLSTVAAQSTSLTSGRPISSLLMAILVVIVSPFTFKSKEPLSLLLRERSHCCSRNVTKLILTVLCKEEIFFFFHLHYSEVLDPPVSMQTDEGITNGQPDTSSRHQIHCRRGQSHIHYLYTGRNNMLVL